MKIDRSKIKLVDAFKIRNMLDIDFATFHGHGKLVTLPHQKFYIPEGEWWLNHRQKDEIDFIIALEELERPSHIRTFNEFRQYERETMCLPGPAPEYVLSRETIDGRNVVMVNGKIIRQYIDPEFIAGGHNFVYDYVPPGEIWIDATDDPLELPYYLIHESYEYDLMADGMGYDSAHDFANAKEKSARRQNGIAQYIFDGDSPLRGKTNDELAKEFYVD